MSLVTSVSKIQDSDSGEAPTSDSGSSGEFVTDPRSCPASPGDWNGAFLWNLNLGISKFVPCPFLWALCLFLVSQFATPAYAQGSAVNHVLQLDGNGSYVELPPNSFDDLEQATVEGWVKWDSNGWMSRFFDFGREWNDMAVHIWEATGTLRFQIFNPTEHSLDAANIVPFGSWIHVACVTGKGGMKFYVGGHLVGAKDYEGSFSSITGQKHNYLGRSNWEGGSADSFLAGQIDEVRVWRLARTREQIRNDMFTNLTGREEGLVGLWNFDDPSQPGKDSSPNGFHGKLMGNAKLAEVRRPTTIEISIPSVIFGRVVDPQGQPVHNAPVLLEQAGAIVRQTATDASGSYTIAADRSSVPYEIVITMGELGSRSSIHSEPGQSHRVDFKLQNAVSLSGAVLALDNSPQEAIAVQLLQATPLAGRVNVYSLETNAPVVATARTDRFADGRFSRWEGGTGLAEVKINSLIKDASGSIWFATDSAGLWKFDGSILTAMDSAPFSNNDVYTLAQGTQGSIWAAGWNLLVESRQTKAITAKDQCSL